MHQGWPKFASPPVDAHARRRAGSGVIRALPGEDRRAGRTGTIEVETDYPFSEEVRLTVHAAQPCRFPLLLHIPAWSHEATLTIAGDTAPAPAGDFARVEREWQGETVVFLRLPMPLAVHTRYHDAIALTHGPLVLSLRVGEEWRKVGGEEPHADWKVDPTTPWNYALNIDPVHPEQSVSIEMRPPGNAPSLPTALRCSPRAGTASARLGNRPRRRRAIAG